MNLCPNRVSTAPPRRGGHSHRKAPCAVHAFLGPLAFKADTKQKVDETFHRAVDAMLNRGSSAPVARGPCSCLTCRGSGTIQCGHCKGAGILDQQAVERDNAVRGALLKFRSAIGLAKDVPYASSRHMRTNRCSRCHGTGQTPCDACSQSGMRFPYLPADDPRQCAGQPGAENCGPDGCNIE